MLVFKLKLLTEVSFLSFTDKYCWALL